jgi:hypothetical protein
MRASKLFVIALTLTLSTCWLGTAHAAPAPQHFTETPLSINGNYQPIEGDFNGDGLSDVLWYAPGPAADSLWLANGDRTFTKKQLSINGNYLPIEGDFNGDGRTDVFWYAPGAAADSIWFFNADGSHATVAESVFGLYDAVVGDFDGNGATDILWYAPGPAPDALWLGQSNRTFRSLPKTINGVYDAVVWYAPDSSGLSDLIFWRHDVSSHPTWQATGGGNFTTFVINSPGAGSIPIVGWYDADQRTDILWYGPGAVPDGIAYAAKGLNNIAPLTINGDYAPIPFNFDGDAQNLDDIFWWNLQSSPDAFWRNAGNGFVKETSGNSHFGTNSWAIWGYFDSDHAGDLMFYGPGSAPDGAFWGIEQNAPPMTGRASATRIGSARRQMVAYRDHSLSALR